MSDIRHDSPRVTGYVETDNEKARQKFLDVLDEERELVAAKSAIYQQDLRRSHSRRIKTWTFQEGNLVALTHTKEGQNAQVILSMGRTVCGQQEPVQWILLPS